MALMVQDDDAEAEWEELFKSFRALANAEGLSPDEFSAQRAGLPATDRSWIYGVAGKIHSEWNKSGGLEVEEIAELIRLQVGFLRR
jgi:hypothetical protein